MAIHKVVLYTPGREYRITADPNGTVFTVERELVFVARFTSQTKLTQWLAEHGFDLADLIVD